MLISMRYLVGGLRFDSPTRVQMLNSHKLLLYQSGRRIVIRKLMSLKFMEYKFSGLLPVSFQQFYFTVTKLYRIT